MADPVTDVLSRALAWIDAGDTPTLAAVVASHGSTPGTPGAVAPPEGDLLTIGGGAVEHDVIGRARSGETGLLHWDHADAINDSLCSGMQTMVLRRLAATDGATLRTIAEIVHGGGHGVLHVSLADLTFEPDETAPPSVDGDSTAWMATLPVGVVDTLYLAGGGHVSLAVSRVVSTLPFRIIVLDDREGLATMEANRWAHERRIIRWRDVADEIEAGPRSWAIVMTAAHSRDREVVSGLLPLELRYLGMLGSRHKVRSVFEALTADGADPARLATVHAPVGLDLGSHTPAEIAVSIAAELVRERNRSRGTLTALRDEAPAARR